MKSHLINCLFIFFPQIPIYLKKKKTIVRIIPKEVYFPTTYIQMHDCLTYEGCHNQNLIQKRNSLICDITFNLCESSRINGKQFVCFERGKFPASAWHYLISQVTQPLSEQTQNLKLGVVRWTFKSILMIQSIPVWVLLEQLSNWSSRKY